MAITSVTDLSHWEEWQPSKQQKLLLQACLIEGREAVAAWEEWKRQIDFDLLDPGSQRLLPHLYKKLAAHRINDKELGRLKGHYRLAWYKNQLFLHNAQNVLQRFQSRNIDTLFLKGAALSLLYYEDYGLRPMSDVDILVHNDDAIKAMQLLQENGWEPISTERPFIPALELRYSHGNEFRHPKTGGEIDLHWHALQLSPTVEFDNLLWKNCMPLTLGENRTQTLAPADQLLLVCVHALPWKDVSPIRWVTDVAMIIQKAGNELDWDRLVQLVLRYSLTPYVAKPLRHARDQFNLAIPSNVIKALEEENITSVQKVEYWSHTARPTLFGSFLRLWFQNSRLVHRATLLQRLSGFLGFLQWYFGVGSVLMLPVDLCRRVLRREWKRERLSDVQTRSA